MIGPRPNPMRLLVDQDPIYLRWACTMLGIEHAPSDVRWIAGATRNEVLFVLVYSHFTERDCQMTIATDLTKRWATRRALQLIFRTPFNFWRLRRLTCLVDESNQRSIATVKRLDFALEGRLAKFFGEERDGLIFGLLRENCKWL